MKNIDTVKYMMYKMKALQSVMECIDSRINDCKTEWGITGEKRQAYHWEGNTKVNEFDEDGNPVMEDVFGCVDKDSLSPEDEMMIKAYTEISESLFKALCK